MAEFKTANVHVLFTAAVPDGSDLPIGALERAIVGVLHELLGSRRIGFTVPTVEHVQDE